MIACGVVGDDACVGGVGLGVCVVTRVYAYARSIALTCCRGGGWVSGEVIVFDFVVNRAGGWAGGWVLGWAGGLSEVHGWGGGLSESGSGGVRVGRVW